MKNPNFEYWIFLFSIEKNEIFAQCESTEDIKMKYEAFWNIPNAIEKITVLNVREL